MRHDRFTCYGRLFNWINIFILQKDPSWAISKRAYETLKTIVIFKIHVFLLSSTSSRVIIGMDSSLWLHAFVLAVEASSSQCFWFLVIPFIGLFLLLIFGFSWFLVVPIFVFFLFFLFSFFFICCLHMQCITCSCFDVTIFNLLWVNLLWILLCCFLHIWCVCLHMPI